MKWVRIKGFEKYEINEYGVVRSVERYVNHWRGGKKLTRSQVLKKWIYFFGYEYVVIYKKDARKGYTKFIHKLLLESFVPNPEGKKQGNHKDGNKLNNNIENLEWCTQKENTIHAYRTGLAKGLRGELSPLSKLTNKQRVEIKKSTKSPASLALEYGVSPCTVRYIRKNFNQTLKEVEEK